MDISSEFINTKKTSFDHCLYRTTNEETVDVCPESRSTLCCQSEVKEVELKDKMCVRRVRARVAFVCAWR